MQESSLAGDHTDRATPTRLPAARDSGHIEPGLLPVFRLYVIFQALGMASGFLVPGVRWSEVDTGSLGVWLLGWSFLLTVYLSLPGLRRRLGDRYLPLALFLATLMPMLLRAVYLYLGQMQNLSAANPVPLTDTGTRLLVTLLAPVVFLAWQYDFRAVLWFAAATLAFNLAIAGGLFGASHAQFPSLIESSVTGSGSYLLIGYIITRLVAEQRARQAALAEANAQLAGHAAMVEQLAVSRERNRLARDMHDTLAHTLSAVAVQLEAVDSSWDSAPREARGLLHRSLDNARGGLAETRRALRALRASPLDDLGLALAVRSLAESTAARAGLRLALQIPDGLSLPLEVEQNVYRIAQEALANVAQHAGAEQIWVSLAPSGDGMRLEVRDDGRGFSPGEGNGNGHYGLRGMQERAHLIGAELTVESAQSRGTTVRLVWRQPGWGEL